MGGHNIGRLVAGIAGALLVTASITADELPAALQKMADTERAFARRAAETTIREAFIAFFADEAVSFEPEPGPARERLRARNQPQPPGVQLIWEPRLGDVAESGDLGYLTGPAQVIVPGKTTQHTNYFSVWKRQADGEYRVILDVGVTTPSAPAFAPGLVRAETRGAPQAGGRPARDPRATLVAADRAMADELKRLGPAAAYRAALHPDARVMRTGATPMTSRDDAVAWLAANVETMTAEPREAEAAGSGELGYTWGRFELKTSGGASQVGYYVRVWTRQADGPWRIATDVTTPPQ